MIKIIRDNSNNLAFRELILQLDQDLNGRYGQDQKQYDAYNIIDYIETVVVAYFEDTPAGCGCFKKYDDDSIEIKRMFVKPEFRGKGISKLVLKELEDWGRQQGYPYSILETGTHQHEAIGLYEKAGYKRIENFGQYINMPQSICMRKNL